MKIIRILSLVALVAALPASASAFGYSVAQHFTWPSQAAPGTNIAVTSNGRGVGSSKASTGKQSADSTTAQRHHSTAPGH